MKVWQAGSHLSEERGGKVGDWSWAQSRRRIGMLIGLVTPYRARTAGAIVFLLAFTLVALVPPLLAKLAVDQGIKTGDLQTLVLIVVAFVLVGLLTFALSSVQTYLTGWVGERALADLRIRLFEHLQRLSLGYFERNRTGAIISRITNDVEALDTLITDGVTLARAERDAARGDGRRALHARLAPRSRNPVGDPADGARDGRGSASARTAPTGACASASASSRRRSPRTSRACGSCSRTRASRATSRASAASTRATATPTTRRSCSTASTSRPSTSSPRSRRRSCSATAATCSSTIRSRSGRCSRSSSTSRTSSTRCSSSRSSTTRSSRRRRRSTRSSRCSTRSPRSSTRRPRSLSPRIDGHVRFENVKFGYGELAEVLHGISLDVPAGTSVALVGQTGAGKSTIAKLIARFYDVREGRITIDGHDVRDVEQKSLRRQLGVVPQEGFLFAGTVAENIAFARPDATRGRDRARRAGSRRRRLDPRARGRVRHAARRARVPALARAAPADRVRAGAARRPADPDPRRGDLVGRHRHRARDRASAAEAPRRADGVRDRASAVDDPERRPDRRSGTWADRGAGHARRADGAAVVPTAASTATGPSASPESRWRRLTLSTPPGDVLARTIAARPCPS